MSFVSDFHVHTTESDGTLSPKEIVEKYVADKYDLIAITDHEVVSGILEAQEAGKDKNLRVVPGIEIATIYEGVELHILGYYFDIEDEDLLKELNELKKYRDERNEKMLAKFNEMGYELKMRDLKERPGQTYIGKPNFARALMRKGYIETPKEAFQEGKFIESEEIKAIKKVRPTAEHIIELINNAGGMAVLAHPGKIKEIGQKGTEEFKENFQKMLLDLKKKGLKGLECIYPEHTEDDQMYFIELAAKYHLHITEGSDFH